MKLHERVGQVRSKGELSEFVAALADDARSHPEQWENQTLEGYLSALARWIEDSDGYYRNHGRSPPENPSWKDVAEMLMAARMYE